MAMMDNAGGGGAAATGFNPWGLIGGAALGGLQTIFGAGKRRRQAELQATTTQYSPWTGLKGESPDEVNGFGNVMQGAAQGLSLGQNLAQAKREAAWDDLRRRYAEAVINQTDDRPYTAPGF